MEALASPNGRTEPTNIFDLADMYPLHGSGNAQVLAVVFDITTGIAHCRVSSELSSKYGERDDSPTYNLHTYWFTARKMVHCTQMPCIFATSTCPAATKPCTPGQPADRNDPVDAGMNEDNQQQVVSVTDRVLGAQVGKSVVQLRSIVYPKGFKSALGSTVPQNITYNQHCCMLTVVARHAGMVQRRARPQAAELQARNEIGRSH